MSLLKRHDEHQVCSPSLDSDLTKYQWSRTGKVRTLRKKRSTLERKGGKRARDRQKENTGRLTCGGPKVETPRGRSEGQDNKKAKQFYRGYKNRRKSSGPKVERKSRRRLYRRRVFSDETVLEYQEVNGLGRSRSQGAGVEHANWVTGGGGFKWK